MFFFIGGVQPKTVTLEDTPRMCRACGLYQARLRRVDHYVSVFFIPLFPIKKGTPFLECRGCGAISSESGEMMGPPTRSAPGVCPACGEPVQRAFRFCPSCGKRL